MDILAHRGYWQHACEQNSLKAIEKAFASGFGLETDLRDLAGRVVVSHDCPDNKASPDLNDLLALYKEYGASLPLALNIKSDGLQHSCKAALEVGEIDLVSVFFFDMSVPDALTYLKQDLPCFTRYSDEEEHPSFLDRARGIWLDGFEEDCVDESVFKRFFDMGLPICLVSPELHGRPHIDVWQKWRSFLEIYNKSGMICTDFPTEADKFFNG